MANPTTYFGWVMPTSSSLVTNLPADFNTFGQAVDTSMSELLGGTTGQVLSKTSNTSMDFTWVTPTDQTPLTTKGDLFTFTTVDARLAVGANGETLVADSSTPTGLKWAAAASGGGMTLLSTTTLSGTSTTVSSISGSYKNLYISIQNVGSSADDSLFFRFNGITAASQYYGFYTTGGNGTTAGAFVTSAAASAAWATSGKIIILNALDNVYPVSFVIIAQDYTKATAPKTFEITGAETDTGDTYNGVAQLLNTTAAISSFTIGSNAGTATLTGSVLIYGVS